MKLAFTPIAHHGRYHAAGSDGYTYLIVNRSYGSWWLIVVRHKEGELVRREFKNKPATILAAQRIEDTLTGNHTSMGLCDDFVVRKGQHDACGYPRGHYGAHKGREKGWLWR